MASSRSNTRAKPGDDPAVATDVAFALQELNACWSQAYDAMTRGELKAVAGLLTAADAYLDAAGEGLDDNPAEQALRRHAASTFGLLQHAQRPIQRDRADKCAAGITSGAPAQK